MRLPFLFLVACTLSAQGLYSNANSPSDPICPLIQRDKTALNYGAPGRGTTGGLIGADATATRSYQWGWRFFAQGERRDVSAFAAYDERSRGIPVSSLRGKVVLVGLWSVHCDPSAKMLMEFARLYPKRAQYGFEILAVNVDLNQQDGGGIEGGWRAINKFMIRNRPFFETSGMPVYTPGLGREGVSNFMDIVTSVPVLFVVDRDGRLAQLHIGYKDGFVGESLKRALAERPAMAPALPATPTEPAH